MHIKHTGQRAFSFVTPVTKPKGVAYCNGSYVTAPTKKPIVTKVTNTKPHDAEYSVMLASRSCRNAGRPVSWIGPWAFDWAWGQA